MNLCLLALAIALMKLNFDDQRRLTDHDLWCQLNLSHSYSVESIVGGRRPWSQLDANRSHRAQCIRLHLCLRLFVHSAAANVARPSID